MSLLKFRFRQFWRRVVPHFSRDSEDLADVISYYTGEGRGVYVMTLAGGWDNTTFADNILDLQELLSVSSVFRRLLERPGRLVNCAASLFILSAAEWAWPPSYFRQPRLTL